MIGSNATVTSVIAPGGLDAYGDATTGTVAWTGRLDCYLRRPRLGGHKGNRGGADREQDYRDDEAVVNANGAGALLATLTYGEAGGASRVTVEDRRNGSTTRTYELVGLDARMADTEADSIRLTLRREA